MEGGRVESTAPLADDRLGSMGGGATSGLQALADAGDGHRRPRRAGRRRRDVRFTPDERTSQRGWPCP
jgi:hypothetical protein